MKQHFLISVILLSISSFVYGQFSNGGSATDYTFGNVGIGTSSPSTELTLYDSDGPTGLSLQSENAGRYWLVSQYNQLQIGGLSGNLPATGALNIDLNGNIGIGSSPTSDKFYVNGLITSNLQFRAVNGSSAFKGGVNDAGGYMNLHTSQGEMNVNIRSYGNSYFKGGKIGIGTDAPIGMLAVKSTGTIGLNGEFGNSYIYVEDGTQKMGIDPNQIYSGQDLYLHATGFLKLFTNNEARLTVLGNGNVGIGTESPEYPLNVNGEIHTNTRFHAQVGHSRFVGGASTSGGYIHLNTNDAKTNVMLKAYGDSYFNGGRVGIGTESPNSTLDVNGTASFSGLTKFAQEVDLEMDKQIGIDQNYYPFNFRGVTQNVGYYGLGWYRFDDWRPVAVLSSWLEIQLHTQKECRLRVRNDGVVEIYKKLEAPDIEVKNVSLPDYVFANDYNLRSLEEVEQFIGQNSHLPEVPSACEVAENGMNITEMSNAMLKKIEELTLYLIDQNKQMQNQTKRIEELEKQNQLLMELLKK